MISPPVSPVPQSISRDNRNADTVDNLLDPTKVEVPFTYAYTPRRNDHEGISFETPGSQFVGLLPENIGWQEAPDPIRQSDFWAAGNKIKADARMWIVSHLALGPKEAVMEDTFRVGKLKGYLKTPTFVGGQHTSAPRVNIIEAQPGTLGSMYEVLGGGPELPTTAPGFSYGGQDGYPY